MNFLRRVSHRHSKLGAGRKKKQTWRRPTGRHNKMRLERKGVPAVVKIGRKKSEDIRPVIVYNLKDLENAVSKNAKEIILGKIGDRAKLKIAEKAKEMKLEIQNLNINKFLKNKLKSKNKTAGLAEEKKK